MRCRGRLVFRLSKSDHVATARISRLTNSLLSGALRVFRSDEFSYHTGIDTYTLKLERTLVAKGRGHNPGEPQEDEQKDGQDAKDY